MNYATLYQIKQYRNLLNQNNEDALLTAFLGWATAFIDRYKGRRYDVRLETIMHDAPIQTRSSFGLYSASFKTPEKTKPLILRDDLLSAKEILNGDGVEITSGQYFLDPVSTTPKSVLTLRNGQIWQPDNNGDIRQVISIKGIWGYHPDYQNAFVDSLDTVLDTSLVANVTQIHVSDVNGVDGNLEAPRFQAGQLVRIDDEFIMIVSTQALVSADDVLTVRRGQNGSTAATHAQGAPIDVFKPMGTIEQACIRLAAWRYAQKDVDTYDKSYAVGTGIVSTPSAFPSDVRELLGAKGRPS
jgi:hypothetical protein